MPYRRDAGLGWGGEDRDWDRDPEGQWTAPRRPNYERSREYERSRRFGYGPDLPSRSAYGMDYDRARYDAEDFGGYDRDRGFRGRYDEWRDRWDTEREPAAAEYYGYDPRYNFVGIGGVYGAPWRSARVGRYFGRGPRGYRRSDERIREDVNDRLTFNGDLDATEIEVRVQNGVVTLSGVVDDRGAKRLAEDLAEDVAGVDDVNNELKVRRGLWARITGERVDEREITRKAEVDRTTRSEEANP